MKNFSEINTKLRYILVILMFGAFFLRSLSGIDWSGEWRDILLLIISLSSIIYLALLSIEKNSNG